LLLQRPQLWPSLHQQRLWRARRRSKLKHSHAQNVLLAGQKRAFETI
jgi:hypothetical protein